LLLHLFIRQNDC